MSEYEGNRKDERKIMRETKERKTEQKRIRIKRERKKNTHIKMQTANVPASINANIPSPNNRQGSRFKEEKHTRNRNMKKRNTEKKKMQR